MMRWFSKRWIWACVFGTTAAVGLALAQGGKEAPSGPPKPGDVITLPFKNGATKQVKVVKVEKQPDGSYLSQVKDTKTGETFTLYDGPSSSSANKPGAASKTPTLPKAKPRQNDPLLPSVKTPMPETPKDKDKESKKKWWQLFGDRSKSDTPADPRMMEEPQKRPGLLGRIFGRKSTSSNTTMPAATTSGKPTYPSTRPTVPNPGASSSMPPAVRPTPPLTPPSARSIPLTPPPPSGTTGEPPRIPFQRAARPNPATSPPANIPAPLPIPVPPPSLPANPPPTLPTTPPPPAQPGSLPGGLPPIPTPPGGVSTAAPKVVPAVPVAPPIAHPVMPAAAPAPMMPPSPVPMVAPAVSPMMKEIQPHMTALQHGFAPSERITAAQTLAGGKHSSTDTVKAAIFQACTSDPCALVRACCIDELCKLEYRDPAFLAHLQKACNDPSEDVRTSAKAALAKLMQK